MSAYKVITCTDLSSYKQKLRAYLLAYGSQKDYYCKEVRFEDGDKQFYFISKNPLHASFVLCYVKEVQIDDN